MLEEKNKSYSVVQLPGLPVVGSLYEVVFDPLRSVMKHASMGADIVSVHVLGQQALLLCHPDLIRHVLVENHKNYIKSAAYIRFQTALGMGLLTSNGDKWKRDRQKTQPMFARQRISGYYHEIVNDVSEKYKRKWLELTKTGSADLDITEEMARITTEIILKSIFGRNISDDTVTTLYYAYCVLLDYLGTNRLLPKVDLRKALRTPAYFKYQKALGVVDRTIAELIEQYTKDGLTDRQNMLVLLMEAAVNDPANFSAQDIRDQAVTMVFGGFETSSIFMQWVWYALDDQAAVKLKLRENITAQAPCTATDNSQDLTFEAVQRMDYLAAVVKEAMRLYPSFWLSGRQPIEDDMLGDFKVKKGTLIALPQIAMQRHPTWWQEPNSFIPERFLGEAEKSIDPGLYFPFSLGPRRCIGSAFAEMEIKTVLAKLVPLFNVTCLNKVGNAFKPGISLKLKHPLMVRISRKTG